VAALGGGKAEASRAATQGRPYRSSALLTVSPNTRTFSPS
jgi:hypothetical protein